MELKSYAFTGRGEKKMYRSLLRGVSPFFSTSSILNLSLFALLSQASVAAEKFARLISELHAKLKTMRFLYPLEHSSVDSKPNAFIL